MCIYPGHSLGLLSLTCSSFDSRLMTTLSVTLPSPAWLKFGVFGYIAEPASEPSCRHRDCWDAVRQKQILQDQIMQDKTRLRSDGNQVERTAHIPHTALAPSPTCILPKPPLTPFSALQLSPQHCRPFGFWLMIVPALPG